MYLTHAFLKKCKGWSGDVAQMVDPGKLEALSSSFSTIKNIKIKIKRLYNRIYLDDMF
jgi:hypothetical protein